MRRNPRKAANTDLPELLDPAILGELKLMRAELLSRADLALDETKAAVDRRVQDERPACDPSQTELGHSESEEELRETIAGLEARVSELEGKDERLRDKLFAASTKFEKVLADLESIREEIEGESFDEDDDLM